MALPGGGLIRFGRRGAAPPEPDALQPGELIGALPAPLIAIDAQATVRDVNGAAETLLNLGRAAIVGQGIEAMIGPLTSVAPDAPFAVYDIALALPGGRSHRADIQVAPLPERPGWRVVLIHPRAPAHLVQRRADRGTRTAIGAAAILAHEIKNPLSGIRGAAQLLEAGVVDEASRDLTRLIRGEVDRVTALIDRMQGFTDTRRLALEPQNIHAILGRAREVARNGFAKGLAVREVYDPSLPPVLGHRDSLIQVLLNLLKNAAEAMPRDADGTPAGAITLRTAYRHGVSLRGPDPASRRPLPIEVCVIDDGPGAPAGIADHLFDPFVTSKREGAGGLGLALVDKLIGDHGGMVEYAREGTPPRTVFRLLLPRA